LRRFPGSARLRAVSDRVGDCLLYHANCFDVLPQIPAESVDLVLADPPYGITQCRWDSVLDLERLWPELWRVTKPRAAVVMTAAQPFSSVLVQSQIKRYRHEWIWSKNRGSNIGGVRYGPMREHEEVIVFGRKAVTYKPIKEARRGDGPTCIGRAQNRRRVTSEVMKLRRKDKDPPLERLRHPSTVQRFVCQVGHHPTQKPVALMQYMIRTYTEGPGAVVLDFCMGSGTTGIAAINTGRTFIGIELDAEHYATAHRRIAEHWAKPPSQRIKPPPKRRRRRKGPPTHQLGLFSSG